jgi:hypothetical protein
MSDLTDELRQLSDDAARHARPQAITEVIKRGNHRRYRTIAQRSIGALSIAGLGAAVLFTGAFSNATSSPGAAAAGGASSKGVITQTQTTSLNGMTLTVKISYRNEPKSTVKVISLTYSGSIKTPPSSLALTIQFGPPLRKSTIGRQNWDLLVVFGHKHQSHFAGSLTAANIRILSVHKPIPATESVNVSLHQQGKHKKLVPSALLANSQILN